MVFAKKFFLFTLLLSPLLLQLTACTRSIPDEEQEMQFPNIPLRESPLPSATLPENEPNASPVGENQPEIVNIGYLDEQILIIKFSFPQDITSMQFEAEVDTKPYHCVQQHDKKELFCSGPIPNQSNVLVTISEIAGSDLQYSLWLNLADYEIE